MAEVKNIVHSFYKVLRNEVLYGNPFLDSQEQIKLQSHYDVIMHPQQYSPVLAEIIYAQRRTPPAHIISKQRDSFVFDAGCGFGSESFLFAALGAKVLAVDQSSEQIDIALKRKLYFEKEIFNKKLDIDFEVADLNEYNPKVRSISLTWIASVLAVLNDQDDFLRRINAATREGGCIMVTDMNLLNPLFLFKEWKRRQKGKEECAEFARHANFWGMVRRKGRSGALYFRCDNQYPFADVQFFTKKTIISILYKAGFRAYEVNFSGFLLPIISSILPLSIELWLPRVPLLANFGYFYLITCYKK